ncbi:MAG: head-tail connector protein [Methyloligellaceae bacterium]
MPIVLTSGPLLEPLTVAEIKTFLRVDNDDEDILISSLITAGRIHIEQKINRKLITQSWSWYLSRWPDKPELTLPLSPVQSVDAIQTYDAEGMPTTWPAENYQTDIYSDAAKIISKNTGWPNPENTVNGIEIQITAGYGNNPSDIPEPVRQALRLMVAHWFENREPVILGETPISVPENAMALLSPFKQVHL